MLLGYLLMLTLQSFESLLFLNHLGYLLLQFLDLGSLLSH